MFVGGDRFIVSVICCAAPVQYIYSYLYYIPIDTPQDWLALVGDVAPNQYSKDTSNIIHVQTDAETDMMTFC